MLGSCRCATVLGGGTSLEVNGTRLLSSQALAAWFFGNDTSKHVEQAPLPLDALGRRVNPSCRPPTPGLVEGR